MSGQMIVFASPLELDPKKVINLSQEVYVGEYSQFSFEFLLDGWTRREIDKVINIYTNIQGRPIRNDCTMKKKVHWDMAEDVGT